MPEGIDSHTCPFCCSMTLGHLKGDILGQSMVYDDQAHSMYGRNLVAFHQDFRPIQIAFLQAFDCVGLAEAWLIIIHDEDLNKILSF